MYEIKKALPSQMDSSCKYIHLIYLVDSEKMELMGNRMVSGGQAMMIGNFAINLIMSGSLQFLWGMINTL